MGDLDGFVTIPFSGPTLVYTNLTGHPTLITRCGMRDGLPQSIEFVGGLYKEAAILRMGHAFEQATEWHKTWPDMTKLG
jgi:Asp-tRNA(Asn)/Glu-tRNA(Gln) amidotransferase A subunit family amidase